jgi:HK97 family phage major capsid protein
MDGFNEMDSSLESEIVRPRAVVYPMQTNDRKIPAWDGSDHTDSLFGGFTGTWMGENETQTVQTGTLRLITLVSHKLGIYTEASREVLADGLSLEKQLGEAIIKACSFYLDYAFLRGNGVAQPLGVLNNASMISINRAVASQVAYADLVSMYSRMHPACLNSAVWIVSHSVMPQLTNMTDAGNHLIWMPGYSGSIKENVPTTLFGKPVILTEKTPSLGNKGDVMLVDFQQYAIGVRQEVTLERSNAPGWTRDVNSFRCILRADGNGLWKEPVTPMGGGDTLSWAVALDVP